MIEFKDITLQDKASITSFTMNSHRRNCDLSFSNLCSWRFLYGTKFAIVDNFLLFKFHSEGKLAYMMPVGKGDFRSIVEKLEEDARQEGEAFRMLGTCSGACTELETAMPDKFIYTSDRNYADYVYLRTDLATLKGKKFQSKRNHINKFKKEYDYSYVPITPDRIQECIELEARWWKMNNKIDGTRNEQKAIIYALEHFEEIGLTGGMLYANGEVVAFTFGMPINNETFGVHVEKANADIDGAYAMINYEFSNRIPEQFTYVNREEDLGIEGLRKAKLSYQPTIILEKHMVYLKNQEDI